MAGDKLLVSDGPNNTATNFIRVEKHIQQNFPEDWERSQFFREKLHPETVVQSSSEESFRPSILSIKKSPIHAYKSPL